MTDQTAARCVCGDPIEWYTGPGGSAGWVHSPAADGPILDVHEPRPAVEAQPAADRAAVLREAADAIDAETRQAKADEVLEPDKYRPCRDASAQLRRMADEAQQPVPSPVALAALYRELAEEAAEWGGVITEHELRRKASIAARAAATLPAVEAQQPKEAGERVVAYRSPGGTALYCSRHYDELGPLWPPVVSEDLPDGGTCTKCGADVLIPQQPEARS